VRYYLKSSSEKQKLLQEEYFQNILDLCGDVEIPFDTSEYMQYFLQVSVYQIGYLMTYTGVYLGALYRKHHHGLERIDYSEYYDYDPDQKPISSCCHNVMMLIGRTVVLSFYLVPLMYSKIYIWNKYELSDGLILSVLIFTFMVFAFYELSCNCVKMDIHYFELKP